MRQLSAHVWGILAFGGFLNAYVIEYEGALTLIDCGIGGFTRTIEASLNQSRYNLSDIKRIIITHAHPDHIGDLANLQARINATTYAHRLEAIVIRGEQGQQFPPADALSGMNRLIFNLIKNAPPMKPARVDAYLEEGMVLDDVLPQAQVIHLPGHAYGQIGIWLPDQKTLIGGDVMMRFPLRGLTMPLRPPSTNWEDAKRSIKRVAEMDVQNLYLGHGTPILGEAHQQIRRLAGWIVL